MHENVKTYLWIQMLLFLLLFAATNDWIRTPNYWGMLKIPEMFENIKREINFREDRVHQEMYEVIERVDYLERAVYGGTTARCFEN